MSLEHPHPHPHPTFGSEDRAFTRLAVWGSFSAAALMWLSFPLVTVAAVYASFIPIFGVAQYLTPFVIGIVLGAVVTKHGRRGTRWEYAVGIVSVVSIIVFGIVLAWYMSEHPWGWEG